MWYLASGGRGSNGSDGDSSGSGSDMGGRMARAMRGHAGRGGAGWGKARGKRGAPMIGSFCAVDTRKMHVLVFFFWKALLFPVLIYLLTNYDNWEGVK